MEFVFCGLLISGRKKKKKIQLDNLLQAQTSIWAGIDRNRLKWPIILFKGEKGVSCSSLHSGKVLTTLVGTQLTTRLVICEWIWLQSNVNWKSMPKKSKQNMISLSLRQRTFKILPLDIQVVIVNIVYYSLLLELMYAC